MATIDEVIEQLGLSDEQKQELTTAIQEAGPKPVREALDRAKAEIAELRPKAKLYDDSQRWPEVEKAFTEYKLDDIPEGLKQQLSAFSELDNPAKVAEFAKTWGLQQKPAGQQPPPETATDHVVDVATDPTQTLPAGSGVEAVLARARAAKTKEEQQRILQEAGVPFV